MNLCFFAENKKRILLFRSICFRFRGKIGKVRKSKDAPWFFVAKRLCFSDGKPKGKLLGFCVKLSGGCVFVEILEKMRCGKVKIVQNFGEEEGWLKNPKNSRYFWAEIFLFGF